MWPSFGHGALNRLLLGVHASWESSCLPEKRVQTAFLLVLLYLPWMWHNGWRAEHKARSPQNKGSWIEPGALMTFLSHCVTPVLSISELLTTCKKNRLAFVCFYYKLASLWFSIYLLLCCLSPNALTIGTSLHRKKRSGTMFKVTGSTRLCPPSSDSHPNTLLNTPFSLCCPLSYDMVWWTIMKLMLYVLFCIVNGIYFQL